MARPNTNGNNNNLSPPSLTLNTLQIPSITHTPGEEGSPDRRSTSSRDGNSPLLSPHSPSSLGGETLQQRSRTNSFNSHVETLPPLSRDGSSTMGGDAVQPLVVKDGQEKGSSSTPSPSPSPLPGSKPDYDDVNCEDALEPEERNIADFHVENNPFAFSPGQLNKLLNPKSLAAFQALGGLKGLEKGLRTDLTTGLSIDETHLDGHVSFDEATAAWTPPNTKDARAQQTSQHPADTTRVHDQDHVARFPAENQFVDRIRVYDRNKLPERKTASFFKLFWDAYNDKIIILLTIAAVISLALGIYEAVSGGTSADWIEGVAIVVAILIVTLVTAANDWQKERQFVLLNKRKSEREVKAIRSGRSVLISIFDITVGDILHIEPGDAIPADGILLSGYGIKCDESSATGESDMMKKTPGQEVWDHIIAGTATKKLDPFLISGSTVLEGVGTYLVTSVGPHSSHGKVMLSLQTPNDPTPLQAKLGKLADYIGYLGTAAAVVLFIVLFIRFLVQLPNDGLSSAARGKAFLDILIVAITVIVVAIPEGLPLAVTLSLAFATTRMVKENNLVRILRACETMGNATVICSDKTGTLTQNRMTVVAGKLGVDTDLMEAGSNNADGIRQTVQSLGQAIRDLFVKSIAINTTAFEGEEEGKRTFIGSKTEVAMLNLLQTYFGLDLSAERDNANSVQLIPFDSKRKCMGVVIRQPSGQYRLFVKGAAEMMLDKANYVVTDVSNPSQLSTRELSLEEKQELSNTITSYSQRSLRNIGILYKDFEGWPPAGARTSPDDRTAAEFDDVFMDMTWIGVVGIQDPLRPEVSGAIQRCNMAGVAVKMVTGDNITTAISIAEECGIKTPDGVAMEGPRFRQLSDEQMDEVLPKLQVLARSSPEDKRILVARLKHLGETVAVTGDGTNDGPALKTADVGFSMGIGGTEVAKEASAIILLDDNFKSIVTAISWGRAVNDSVAKFLQFQVTVNITAVILTFVSAVASSDNHSVLTAVQLLWVNLIMDTFAALALATDSPTDKILDRKPTPKKASLFTTTMWKMIFGQAIYQLVVTFVLFFAGAKILHYDVDHDEHLKDQLDTIVFNTFVWMQIFNEFNNRRLDNKFNILEGAHKNYWLMGITFIMVGGQILIVFVGGEALQVTRITGPQWAICVVCGICCIPWAMLLRLFPDRYMAAIIAVVSTVCMAVWRPVRKVLELVWWPFGKLCHAIYLMTRCCLPKSGNADGEKDDSMQLAEGHGHHQPPADEEAAVSAPISTANQKENEPPLNEKSEEPKEKQPQVASAPEVEVSPQPVPVLTVTAESTHSLPRESSSSSSSPPTTTPEPPLPTLTVTGSN